MAKPHRRSLWADLSSRGRMFVVLAVCCLCLAVSSAAGLAIIGHPGQAAPDTTAPAESLVTENDYDRTANSIPADRYEGTVLPVSEDAGEAYLTETLFLGDSNTARMYRLFDYCTYENAIGSVGMSARSLANYACVGFEGYGSNVTMPEAVALMQPVRVIITFGTNDLNPNTSDTTFISNYEMGIKAVQEAYPSVDIIVNAIPPLGRQRSSEYLTQKQADAWNLALVEMCEANGWKFLNSAEALKDEATGYARSGYVEADGIHLTRAAFDAFFAYVRTHSYLTQEDRPALQPVPRHIDDRDVVETQALATPEPAQNDAPAAPAATPEPTPTPTPMPDDPVVDDPAPPAETPTETPPEPTAEPAQPPEAPQEPTATPEQPPEVPQDPTEAPPAETPTEAPQEPAPPPATEAPPDAGAPQL